MNNTSIRTKFIIIFSGIIFTIAAIMTFLSLYSLNQVSQGNIQAFKKSKYEDKTQELKENVHIAMGIIEYFYNSDLINKKELALEAIKKIRYGTSGYFWIHNVDLKMVMHPIKPSLDGKSLENLKDTNGQNLFVAMNKVANGSVEGGKVSYYWPKPNVTEAKEKFSYVQKFAPWGWILGTGSYVDDIEKDMSMLQDLSDEEIVETTTSLILTTLIILIISYFIITYSFNKLINNSLKRFKKYFNRFLRFISMEDNKYIQADVTKKDEINDLLIMINETAKKFDRKLKDDVKVMGEVVLIASKVEQGIYRCRVNALSENPMIMTLKSSLNSLLGRLEQSMTSIEQTLDAYSKQEFTKRIQIDPRIQENMLAVMNGVNRLGETLEYNANTNLKNGQLLENNSTIMTNSMENLSKKANEQAASLEEVSASLDEITSQTRETTKNAQMMANLGTTVKESVAVGQTLANDTASSMDEINQKVSAILESITIIDQIAFQTNILSLNAAVEAATAGEAGKGFAVVAQEVRNLASRSAEAAREIQDLVVQASQKTTEGKQVSQDMIEGYNTLNKNIEETIKLIDEVSNSSQSQINGIEQINNSVAILDRMTQENASEANSVKELSNDIKSMAEDLVSTK
ncbi:MAG: cache domain-containing protein [Arcobacteraceae bacterium]